MTDINVESYLATTPEQTERFGELAAPKLEAGMLVFLTGELGAGKTTWVRGVLRGLHHEGPVKSPTYTLLEPYYLQSFDVYHFDLYRVTDPQEIEFLGMRDYLDNTGVCLIEWPERAYTLLPEPDCRIEFLHEDHGRRLIVDCTTPAGEVLCASRG